MLAIFKFNQMKIMRYVIIVHYIFITQAYLVIFDNGGGNLERDFSSARAFEMLSA